MADEATTTKWTVKHEPVNEDHRSQRNASKNACYSVVFGNESERKEFGNSYVAMIMV